MMKKAPYLIAAVALSFFSTHALNAMSRTTRTEVNEDGETVEYSEEDVWFGPGYYYGIWFDDEDDYWRWRGNHRHYPPNHSYYNRERPVHYPHRDGERDGERGRRGGGEGRSDGRGGGHR